jgi:hypothetical protein
MAKKGLPPAWTFPRHPLEDALRIARTLEDKFAGKPTPAEDLARGLGFNRADDWRFLEPLRSANQYGLVSGSGARSTVEMAPIGVNLVAPSDPTQRRRALQEAFNNVELFRQVAEHYGDKPIPEDEFFINTVTRQFGVPRERAETFSEVFRKNIAFLRSFQVEVAVEQPAPARIVPDSGTAKLVEKEPPRPRTSLETCFVMMPFGNWFDRYYREIYVPAINEAGFDAVRADELFSSGSVVEQIWEQIQKSSVLLADLTDRNANVFYELGLAHADIKPVVFTAAKVEDVPFDLRHLRVIIYDVREPQWDMKLRSAVTDYIRSAKRDPGKSIPHPFRQKLVQTTSHEL